MDELTGAGNAEVHANPDQTAARAADRPDREEPGRDLDRPVVDGASRRRSVRLRRLSPTTSGSGYAEVGRTDAAANKFTDTGLTSGTTYYYVVKALDVANNLSPASAEASGVPSALAVDVTLVVTPPASTPANASVYIAGNQPELCTWCNQHTTKLTKGDDGKWRITITWPEGTTVEYKYTLGD